jgi:hypothetical protein
MKNLSIYPILIMLLSGCSSVYYQLYQVESTDLKLNNNFLLSENNDLNIVYNFWSEYGIGDILIENKTDSSVYIDLGRSHLIVNGIANTYFQNRTITKATSSSFLISSSYGSYTSQYTGKGSATASASAWNYGNYSAASGNSYSVSSGTSTVSGRSSTSNTHISLANSVTIGEQQIVIIPPRSAKVISGFYLNSALYKDCNLVSNPSRKENKISKFNKDNSPFMYRNFLTYSFDKEFTPINELSDLFWVSEISNYSNNEFTEYYQPQNCGKNVGYQQLKFKYEGPDKFYIEY